MKLETLDSIFNLAAPIPNLIDVRLYCDMRDEYLARCARTPQWSRCALAFLVCVDSFDLTADQITAHDRHSRGLVETRQKMMAFCRVVSLGNCKPPNTWQGIARQFRRTHSTVIHATQKYGALIAAALEVSK